MKILKLVTVCVCLFAGQLAAQDYYPNRPVRVVVPHPAGGNIDVLARVLFKKLSEEWRQPVVVDNRSGGVGAVANEILSKATPDGYTLLVSAGAFRTAVPYLNAEMSYTPMELIPTIKIGEFPFFLVVHPAVPSRTVGEFVALAKARPGTLTYGSSGVGSAPHLASELFNDVAGIKMLHVPYKGVSLAAVALVGGEIHLMWNSWGLLGPQVKSGRLRAVGVGSEKRMFSLPEVPAISEQYTGYRAGSWAGLFAPMGTERRKIDNINQSVTSILEGEMKQYLTAEGVYFAPHSPGRFAMEMANESLKNKKLIEQLRKSGKLE